MFNPALVTPSPVIYESRFEKAEDDESEPPAPFAHPHVRAHGLLRGELRVLTGLPPALAQGLFSTPMAFPILIQLSTISDDLVDARASTRHGMAIKVVGVEGARLLGSEGDVTQDFLLVSGPSFDMASATGKAPGLKKVFSAMARGAEKVIEKVGGDSATLKGLVGHPDTHILGEAFYTQVPMLHGPYMAKMSVVPISPGMLLLKDAPLDLRDKPDGLRDAVVDFFGSHSAEWELRIQLCTDIAAMPIEDASADWPEALSPHLPVARITVAPQQAWSEARADFIDGRCAFSPWHGLAAHRPLGSTMRAHKAAHATSKPHQEPRSLDELPD